MASLGKANGELSSTTETGPTSREKFIDGRGLSAGLSGKAAEMFLFLLSDFGFRVVESSKFTRRHQGTISKAIWSDP